MWCVLSDLRTRLAQVPEAFVSKTAPGYVFDLATMWDQYKTTLPLILSVYPEMGDTLLQGLLNLKRRFGEFPTGYTMDDDVHRFDGQARGLAQHTLADALYRNYTLDWSVVQDLMASTFHNTTEGRTFVADGLVGPAYTHTLDLAGAAYATSQVAARTGSHALAETMLRLSGNWANVFNTTTCLLKNTSEAHYYEGTYMNYGFRPVPDMAARIRLCGKDTAHFVALLDSFFGYGREPAVQLPIYSAAAGGVPAWYKAVQQMGFASRTFEGLCNEPDMETPYTYAYAGRADRVQEVVSAVKTYSYAGGRGGLAGNDDSGGEAAWFVWASSHQTTHHQTTRCAPPAAPPLGTTNHPPPNHSPHQTTRHPASMLHSVQRGCLEPCPG